VIQENKGAVMHFLSFWKWPALAATGLLVVAGALIANKVNTGGYWGARPCEQSPESVTTFGEQNMSIAQVKSQVQHADETNFSNIVLKSNIPVLVDFYAEWCGPCKRLAPILEELAAEVPNVKIVKINVEDSPSLASEYGIDSIPSLKVFRNGQVSEELVGLASKPQLRAMLDR
jgi:thioredoxin 1